MSTTRRIVAHCRDCPVFEYDREICTITPGDGEEYYSGFRRPALPYPPKKQPPPPPWCPLRRGPFEICLDGRVRGT